MAGLYKTKSKYLLSFPRLSKLNESDDYTGYFVDESNYYTDYFVEKEICLIFSQYIYVYGCDGLQIGNWKFKYISIETGNGTNVSN